MTFHKYPKIKTIGTKDTWELLLDPSDYIYIQEKIDGANFRFMPTEDGKIIFGSRNNSIGDSDTEIGGNWKRCVDFILEKTSDVDLSSFNGWIFYGECCIKHSLDYDWDSIPPYLGFDILHPDGTFVPTDMAKTDFEYMNLPFVPILYEGTASGAGKLDESSVPKSEFASTKAEGIVIKNYNKQIFGKLVTTKFKEINRNTFGANGRNITNDDQRIVAKYCTNARIDKQVFKLVDDGNELDMPLMQWLPYLVWQDIVEEHYDDILISKHCIDIKQIRRLISKRCITVLKQIITNNALNGE